ncbi:MAG: signal recognition particle receptor subunit alpha, partial [Bacillota bacterium]
MNTTSGVGRFVRSLFAKPGGKDGKTPEQGKPPGGAPERGEDGSKGMIARLGERLARTRGALIGKVEALLKRRTVLDEEFFEELEAILLQADVGVRTTSKLLASLTRRIAEEKPRKGGPDVMAMLKDEILGVLGPREPLKKAPSGTSVIMVVGVNGTGKTTTAGKLGYRFGKEGARVILGAADT